MIEKIFTWFGRSSIKRPVTVIVVISLVTVLFVVGLTRIEQEYGTKIMLSDSSETVRTMNEAEELFGGIDEEQVLVEAEGPFNADLLRKVAAYREFLQGEPDVWENFITEVGTPVDEMVYFDGEAVEAAAVQTGAVPQVDQAGAGATPEVATSERLSSRIDALSDEELVRQVELNLENRKRQLEKLGVDANPQNVSGDGRAILLTTKMNPLLTTSQSIQYVQLFTEKTEAYFEEVPGARVYIAGMASMNRESSISTISDTKSLFVIAAVFILLILFLTFRRVTDVLFTVLVMAITLVWVMGLSGWLGFPFSYGNTAIMPLLLGIDIAYAIHVLSRYYEERGTGDGPERSALTAVVTVGVAVFLTAATTAFGFASFGISNMPIIQQFGILCVVGVMASFLLAVTLLPAVIVLRDRSQKARRKWAARQEKKKNGKQRLSPIDTFLARIAVLSEHHRRVVAVVSLLIVLACAALGFNVGTEADIFKMLPQDLPFLQATEKINDYFGGQEIVLTLFKGDILEPANLEAMLAYEEALASNDYVNEDGERLFQREKIFSIADIVKSYSGSIPSSRTDVLKALGALQQSSGSGQSASENQLVTEDLETALISIRLDRGSQQDMKVLAETIERETAAMTTAVPGIAMNSSGFPLLVHEMLGAILPTQLKTMAVALVLCTLIVILIFRSFFFGLAAASVVFISVALELGVLSLLGWPLDFMTVMVSSLVIGAGIDFGIHITHRFVEEWHDGGVEIDEAIRRTVGNVGKALLSAAVTTAGAFFILSFSKIDYMQRFGVITALSLVFALLSSLLILPSILAWHAQRLEKKKART